MQKGNQRNAQRFFLMGGGALWVQDKAYPIEILNRSKKGLFVAAPIPVPLGTQVELRLKEAPELQAICRVVRQEPWGHSSPYLFGMQLQSARSEAASLERWLRFNRDLMQGLLYGKAHGDPALDRSYPRTTVPLPATVEVQGQSVAGTVLNLSEQGIGLLTSLPLAKEERYAVSIALPDLSDPLRLVFKVNWQGRASEDTPIGLGLEILGFKGDGQALWLKIVQDDLIVLF